MRTIQKIPIFISTLLLLTLANASPLTTLLTIRKPSGSDLRGNWTRIRTSGNGKTLCPQTMNFTTYSGGSAPNTFNVRHNTIIHDGKRCSGNRNRVLVYYNSSLLNNKNVIPMNMKNILTNVGTHKGIIGKLGGIKENFLVGYERDGLFCGGQSKFLNGTVLYLIRPFTKIDLMDEIGTLRVGSVYQIVVPRFSASTCLFENRIKKDDKLKHEGGDGDDKKKNDRDGGAECFPGDVMVQLQNGRLKKMDQLNVGDRVMTGNGRYSEVFMFTHKIRKGRFEFIQIETETRQIIKLTSGHYIYLNGRLAASSTAKAGDFVTLANGYASKIRSVKRVIGTGLYNPQTLDGDIIVNGVVASTYTTAVAPSFAHSLLCPFRAAYNYFGFTTSFFNRGGKGLQVLAPRGASTY